MTAKEIYSHALAIVSQSEGENETWDGLAPMWLNMALVESLNAENALRRYNSLAPLLSAPRLKEINEEPLPYNDRLFGALVEQMAAFLWTDQDEGAKAQDCRNRAAAELMDCMVYAPGKIKDLY